MIELIVKRRDILNLFGNDELELMRQMTIVRTRRDPLDPFHRMHTTWQYPSVINLPEIFLVKLSEKSVLVLNECGEKDKVKEKKEGKEETNTIPVYRIAEIEAKDKEQYDLLFSSFLKVGKRRMTVEQLSTVEHLLSVREKLSFSVFSWSCNRLKDRNLHKLIFNYL